MKSYVPVLILAPVIPIALAAGYYPLAGAYALWALILLLLGSSQDEPFSDMSNGYALMITLVSALGVSVIGPLLPYMFGPFPAFVPILVLLISIYLGLLANRMTT